MGYSNSAAGRGSIRSACCFELVEDWETQRGLEDMLVHSSSQGASQSGSLESSRSNYFQSDHNLSNADRAVRSLDLHAGMAETVRSAELPCFESARKHTSATTKKKQSLTPQSST